MNAPRVVWSSGIPSVDRLGACRGIFCSVATATANAESAGRSSVRRLSDTAEHGWRVVAREMSESGMTFATYAAAYENRQPVRAKAAPHGPRHGLCAGGPIVTSAVARLPSQNESRAGWVNACENASAVWKASGSLMIERGRSLSSLGAITQHFALGDICSGRRCNAYSAGRGPVIRENVPCWRPD